MPRQEPQVFWERILGVPHRIQYLVYLPDGYDTSEAQWPMMLFLHGAGERGSDLEQVKAHGPPKLVSQGQALPFVIVAPQCPRGQYWTVALLSDLLDEATSSYRVDRDRIYVTGISMGGYGTWHLACAEPGRFAAIIPICGGGDPRQACRLQDLPIWAFHGAKDTIVPLDESERMVNAVNRCGGSAKLTIYAEAGHDSWTPTYENPAIYEWLLAHRRSDRLPVPPDWSSGDQGESQ